MNTNTYFTGTTVECLVRILEDGCIRTCPPGRVWPEFSQQYVYFVPSENEYEDRDRMFQYAMEQASFAVSALDGTRRVVLEITGIDEELLEEDPDGEGIYAVQYPKDVPVSCIKNIYLETKDHSREIKEMIAITFFYRAGLKDTDIWGYLDDGEDDGGFAYGKIGIKDIHLVDINCLCDESQLDVRFDELREQLDYEYDVREWSISDFIGTFLSPAV